MTKVQQQEMNRLRDDIWNTRQRVGQMLRELVYQEDDDAPAVVELGETLTSAVDEASKLVMRD